MKKIPTIQTVMTPFPWSVDSDAPLRLARRRMQEHEIRHLPVSHDGRLVGVLTDRDLKRALDPSLGMPPKDELFVEDVMVRDAYVVPTTTALDRVLQEMAEQHIGCALVTREGKLAGIFTTTDACAEFAEHLRRDHGADPGDDDVA
ncbi:MAG: CBS domain-containing protein [Myxococcota bacterium]